jgi:hypothetical protein
VAANGGWPSKRLWQCFSPKRPIAKLGLAGRFAKRGASRNLFSRELRVSQFIGARKRSEKARTGKIFHVGSAKSLLLKNKNSVREKAPCFPRPKISGPIFESH